MNLDYSISPHIKIPFYLHFAGQTPFFVGKSRGWYTQKDMCFFSKLLWAGILQAYLPKDLGHFGDKTTLNRPNQILAFFEKNGTFLTVHA